ncbi:MAG: enoyl-CoA hydratase-related protein [Myxococcales bacterium]|nr:enoyl-CoA hydratase-related protein [Myxococcales bacterium]MDD9970121.1 enoyl-CoA hydratase-related protein [Myxococcales bacterium]
MDFTELEYERQGAITIIKFNRPESRNCIGPTTHEELVRAWTHFRDDQSAKVAILTGVGEIAFCSGADLKAAERLIPDTQAEVAAHVRGERPGILGPSRWTDIYKPIIAAVNGAAYAGGLEWACFADLRIAEEHATFGVTCRRWNIGLVDGGTVRLPRIVGFGRALDLILTGRVIDAQEAERIGLVSEVVPSGHSLERAIELATYLSTLPQGAMRTDKESVIRGYGRPLREAFQIEAECFMRLVDSPEMREGLRRFATREHPDLRADAQPTTPGLKRD